jgi:glutathione S-transferase
MSLTLYYHPLSSFCWKVLIPLYENGTAFEPKLIDLGNEASRAELLAVWPIGKFPVLRDGTRDRVVPESSTIIEYLDQHHRGPVRLLPDDPDLVRQTRLRDRFIDLYVHLPMQKIVGDRLRPANSRDPWGVDEARRQLETSLGMLEKDLAGKAWIMGESFGLADCAASPALYYANKVQAFGERLPNVAAYLRRLMERPAFARVLQEAEPYFGMFPT